MLFANTSLARRIERAECRLIVDLAEAGRVRNPGADVLIASCGQAAAIYAGAGSPLNKLAGLGLEPVDEGALAAIEEEHARRRAPMRIELSTLADGAIPAALTRRGYALTGFENVLGLRLDAACVARLEQGGAAGNEVRRVGKDELDAWIEVVARGFAHPDVHEGPAATESFGSDTLTEVFRDFADAPLERYVAVREGSIAGGASARFHEGVALLCGASTLPEHRRRGVQTELLRARLLDAARAGCDLAVVTTEPGSKSQENVQRQGFSLLYARAVLVRAAPEAADAPAETAAVGS
jgi:GNAT superfamily N-acetyltransferase